ncbi:SBBP repeat-containing protein [Leptospira venezuelensis]|uniref:SBBP repeat-containing protein n=1 Tax=Leptospira venezuelensis TaxID=1958811 RepID=UPI001F387201|nr:SBBP repeat-containing protein [Leptospira venezuelensis]
MKQKITISLWLISSLASIRCDSGSNSNPFLFLATLNNGNSSSEWTKLMGVSALSTNAYGITYDSSGNVYTTGETGGGLDSQTLNGLSDLFVVKTNRSGTKLWTRLSGVASTYTGASGISADSSGNVYVTGVTEGNLDGQTLTGNSDLLVIKYNGNGAKQWTRLLGVAGKYTRGVGIASDPSGNVYVTGQAEGNLDGQTLTGIIDLFVVKYNSNGVKQWTRLLGVSGVETYGRAISTDSSGNVYATGDTDGNLDGQTAVGLSSLLVVKYDSSGTRQWTRLLGLSGVYTIGTSIASDSSGNVYATGETGGALDGQTYQGGSRDIFVVKYDDSGAKQWAKLLGSSDFETGNGITTDSFQNIYIAGSTSGNLGGKTLTGSSDMFIARLNRQ